MIGVLRPSASTYGLALVAIRPVAMTTGTPRATVAATARRVRSRMGPSSSMSVPSRSRATRRTGKRGSGRASDRRPATAARRSGTWRLLPLGRSLDADHARPAGEVASHRRRPSGQVLGHDGLDRVTLVGTDLEQ